MSARDEAEALRDERNHWIGEAKKFERMWRYADENGTRWLAQRDEAREVIARVEVAAARLADMVTELHEDTCTPSRGCTGCELLLAAQQVHAAIAGEGA